MKSSDRMTNKGTRYHYIIMKMIYSVIILLVVSNAAVIGENKYYERPMTEWTADEIKAELNLMSLVTQELFRLQEQVQLPFFKKEDLSRLKQGVLYRVNGIVAQSLCSENAIFCNIASEIGTYPNLFSIEFSGAGRKMKYFFSFTDQNKIEFKAVYIFENNNWKKVL